MSSQRTALMKDLVQRILTLRQVALGHSSASPWTAKAFPLIEKHGNFVGYGKDVQCSVKSMTSLAEAYGSYVLEQESDLAGDGKLMEEALVHSRKVKGKMTMVRWTARVVHLDRNLWRPFRSISSLIVLLLKYKSVYDRAGYMLYTLLFEVEKWMVENMHLNRMLAHSRWAMEVSHEVLHEASSGR